MSIENFYIDLFKITREGKFSDFVNYVYGYDVPKTKYNKKINIDYKSIVFECINKFENKNPVVKYYDENNWFKAQFKFEDIPDKNKIYMELPINLSDLSSSIKIIVNFCLYNNINFILCMHKTIKNLLLRIEVFNKEDSIKIINFLESNNKLSKIESSKINPLLIKINNIGIYFGMDDVDFKNMYIRFLYQYLNKCNIVSDVSLENFKNYVIKHNSIHNILGDYVVLLIDYLDLYNNQDNLYDIFNKLFI